MQIKSILPGHPDWNYSQFRLQLILSHPNIEILSIQKNPFLGNPFENKENYFKIDAAIDVSQQKQMEINYLKNNSKKGSIFQCGRIKQQCKLLDGLGSPKIFRILLFKIAVKKLLPIYQSSSITKEELNSFTQQYDSIYISTKKQELSVYDHQYFLKSTTQYAWQYDIQYRYVNANQPSSKIRKWNPQLYKCQQCQLNNAYWYCEDEKLFFCRECYQQTHRGKNRNPHKKQQLNPFNCHKKCPKAAHNQNPLQFYCISCKSTKCIKCLSDSNHTLNRYQTPEALYVRKQSEKIISKKALHEVLPTKELIKLFKEQEKQINSELKQKVANKIKQIQFFISQKSKKYDQKLKQLEENLTQAISKLKKQSRKEINEAISVHIELKRKFDQILWMEKFVSYNEQVLDAESNIQLKEIFSSFLNHTNTEEYFRQIQHKISQMKVFD